MVRLLKEDIEGIRYCVISRSGNSRFYIVEKFCDSLQDARNTAEQYLDNYPEDESWGNEYWVFDTKKWKPCYSPANDPFDVFNSNIPIYRNDNGKAELLADYIGKRVNDYTGRWKKESYKKNIRKDDDYFDEEYCGKRLRKGRKSLQKESESMMPNWEENGSYCIMCYNEIDADFGHDPGPQIVEDNLTQEYAEARAEELNASAEPFVQYWAERERERYW